jgi:hypothetical protein
MRRRATSYVESAPWCGKGLRWSVESWVEGLEHWKRWKVARQRQWRRVTGERGYSRLAFFDVCIFVTASEGEELIVDI